MTKQIVKRDGTLEDFNEEKIFKALRKAFLSTNVTFKEEEVRNIEKDIVSIIKDDTTSVEEVQDLVEKQLMSKGYYDVARHYIIYREERSKKRQYRYSICDYLPSYNLYKVLKEIQKDYQDEAYDLSKLLSKFKNYFIFRMSETEKMHCLIHSAVELTSFDSPHWDDIAGRLFMVNFNYELKGNLVNYNLLNFKSRLELYVEKFRYDKTLLTYFSDTELILLEKSINKNRDKFLSFNKIKYLLSNFIIRINECDYIQSIQEFFMIVSMLLAKEKGEDVNSVERYYQQISKNEINLTSPQFNSTLKNLFL